MTSPTPLAFSPALTREQAAEYLNVGVTTIDALRAAGELDPVLIAGSKQLPRFLRSDLDAYLESAPRASTH